MKGAADFRDPFVWLVALAVAVVHLATAGRYDFFRNELYFIACGRHPAFGYADLPPLVPLLAATTQYFGANLFLLRLPAALASAALAPITAAIAFRLGGGRGAGILAAVATAIAPGLIALTTTLGTPTFEPVQWTLVAYLTLRAVQGERRMLLWAGLVAGIGLETKYGIAIWLVGLVLGVLALEGRRVLASREFMLALLLTSVIGAPSLIWQALHGWPFLEIVTFHSKGGVRFTGSLAHFWKAQALGMDFIMAPLALAGLVAPFFMRDLKAARAIALAFVVTAAAVYASHGKDYYLYPAYPALFAAGAVAASRLSRWILIPWAALAFASTAAIAPLVLPVLEPEALRRFIVRTGLAPEPNEQAAIGAPITQIFSDQFGWRELAVTTGSVFNGLSEAERADAALFASNYGEAGALDFYGVGLPPASSGDSGYFFFGPHEANARTIVIVNYASGVWRRHCGSFQQAAMFGVDFAMPYERNRPISICRDLDAPLGEIWEELRRKR
jgi:4-amino-4-deoxy-L-arabinose transferase-like glycosyltransferase